MAERRRHRHAIEGAVHGIIANSVLPFGLSRMVTETIGGEQVAAELPFLRAIEPELVVPIVVFLASRACEFTHHNYSAGAGRYARVFIGLGNGWLAEPGSQPTADDIAAHLAEVSAPGLQCPGLDLRRGGGHLLAVGDHTVRDRSRRADALPIQIERRTPMRDNEGNRDALARLGLLASALSGRALEVAAGEPCAPAWTDGRMVLVDAGASTRDQLEMLSVQASLLAAGSLEPTSCAGSRGARHWQTIPGRGRPSAQRQSGLLPPSVRSLIDSDVSARRFACRVAGCRT
jgi:hypothetical protein